MKRIQAIKVGVGVGLMAVSLGALANQAVHSFATGSIYYKNTAGGATYVVNVPTGNSAADTTVLVELQQNSVPSLNTWAYAVATGVFAAAANAGASWSQGFSVGITGVGNSAAASYYDFNLNKFSSSAMQGSAVTVSTSNSWYGGDTQAMTMGFIQGSTISSQACPATFVASLGTNDVLQYTSWTIQPTEFFSRGAVSKFTLASTFFIQTKSFASTLTTGSTADYFVSFSRAAGDAVQSVSLPTYAYTGAYVKFIITGAAPVLGAAAGDPTFSTNIVSVAQTVTGGPGSAGVAAYNKCVPYQTRLLGLNGAGNVIGAGVGLNRLW